MLMMIRCILEISKQIMTDMDASLEFDCACCVDEAFNKLSTGQYDIVISDYEMPKKDGLQFLKELREQKNQIPFVSIYGQRPRRNSYKSSKPWCRRILHQAWISRNSVWRTVSWTKNGGNTQSNRSGVS